MKLTVFLCMLGIMQVSANTGLSQGISLSVKDAPLKTVLKEIRKQTNYTFFLQEEALRGSKPVTASVKNVDIEQALTTILQGQPIGFSIVDRTIILTPRTATPPKEKEQPIAAVVVNDFLAISGIVTDKDGKPIEGATVRVKGTNKGTYTDAEGHFTLPDVSSSAVLMISSVTYQAVTINLDGRSMLKVSLELSQSELDQVQIIGYGTTTRRFSTGNVTTVKAEDIEKQPVQNPLLALQGRVPGLVVTQNTGMAGGGVTVRIQGQNSIAKGNNPLYIIDGVPFLNELVSSGLDAVLGESGSTNTAGATAKGSPLNYINPADIESIDVLKDADATAIYGSRGANGVILITTKKGKAGKTAFNLNLQQGWGRVASKIEMLNRRQYLDMRYEALANDGIDLSTASETSTRFYDLKLWDTTRSTNWQDELIGQTAQYTNVNADVSGGTEAVRYRLGATYNRQTTVFPISDDFNDHKISVSLGLNSVSSNKKFRTDLSVSYLVDNNRLPSVDLTQNAVLMEPVAPALYNPDGSLNWEPNANGSSSWINPMISFFQKYDNQTINLFSSGTLSYELMPGLSLKSTFGYNNVRSEEFTPSPISSYLPEIRAFVSRRAVYGNRDFSSFSIEPQLNYNSNIGRGKLDVLLGASVQQNKADVTAFEATGFDSDKYMEDIRAATQVNVSRSVISEYKYNALFGRVNYNWRGKYILNVTGRRDGSSRFGSSSRFHNFGAAGAAWIFSEENWVRGQLGMLSFGKLRASYGSTGNDNIGDYVYLPLYNITLNNNNPYQGVLARSINGLNNPYLEWEETRKLQLGMDLGFWEDRILLNVTYSRNRSSNQLLRYNLPYTSGAPSIEQNFPATVQNTTWEFTLNTVNIQSSLVKWTSSLNVSLPENKLIAFPDLENSSYANTLIVGQPLDVVKTIPFGGVNKETGQYQFYNSKGELISTGFTSDDFTVRASATPIFYGGFVNSLSIGGLSLDFTFQFMRQKAPLNTPFYYYNGFVAPGRFFRGLSNQYVSVLDHWKQPGDEATVQPYTTSSAASGPASLAEYTRMADASFIRLKNLSISWQLPRRWRSVARLMNCQVYIQGQNLLTITPFDGLDPETKSLSSLPPLQIWTAGVRLGW